MKLSPKVVQFIARHDVQISTRESHTIGGGLEIAVSGIQYPMSRRLEHSRRLDVNSEFDFETFLLGALYMLADAFGNPLTCQHCRMPEPCDATHPCLAIGSTKPGAPQSQQELDAIIQSIKVVAPLGESGVAR